MSKPRPRVERATRLPAGSEIRTHDLTVMSRAVFSECYMPFGSLPYLRFIVLRTIRADGKVVSAL